VNERTFYEMLDASPAAALERRVLSLAHGWAKSGDVPTASAARCLFTSAELMSAWTAWRTQVGYSMPCREVIEAIEERSEHLVEIGAGLGFWTAVLRARALAVDPDHPLDVVATDDSPRPGSYTHVARLSATRSVQGWPERDVIVASPSYGPDLPFGAALAMQPGRLLFWYEGRAQRYGGYQGAEIFARMLSEEFEEEAEPLELVNAWGHTDLLSIHRRVAR
jgi:hypothetical protein